MLEIDYLMVSKRIRDAGIKKGIQRAIRMACKNIAAGEPYQIKNAPGDTVEINGIKYLVTSKGRLCPI